jgi:DUF4097 and DUF4098 domain-containing protein YvlB
MTMMIAATTLLMALVIQGPARDTRPPQTDETISVTKGARLVVENFAGEVVVKTWDRDSLRVQARHGGRAKVDIRQTPTIVTVRSESGGIGSVDYDISAPAWMTVRVTGSFNFITVEGTQGEVHAETTRGDVVIKGGTGTVTAKSIQGQVIVEGARGKVTAVSVNESIRIADSSGDIMAETNNGHITLTGIKSADVEVATINGNIVFEGPPADRGRYRFTTHNGNITVAVPEAANVTFIVRTYNGSFSSTLNLAGPPRSEVRQGRRNTYTLGTGSAEMEMETFGGFIRVRRPGEVPSRSDAGKQEVKEKLQ